MDPAREQDRKQRLQAARQALFELPGNQRHYELAGRPAVVYEIRDYSRDKVHGSRQARLELPFLFKAFEVGQSPPPRPGSKNEHEPRAATIHEYLDWTVTSATATGTDPTDFTGFRVLALLPRHRPMYPPPGAYDEEGVRLNKRLGAPKNPLPVLLVGGKPICAATVRAGLGWLEVPFFATQETRRNRGFGRCMLEAIEEVARALDIWLILLCSTDDPVTKGTWQRLGFQFTTAEDLRSFGVQQADMLHMDNTVQMHKHISPSKPWKSLVLRHQHWRHRVYYPARPAGSGRKRQQQPDEDPQLQQQRQQQRTQNGTSVIVNGFALPGAEL